jgi:hypothetical protein
MMYTVFKILSHDDMQLLYIKQSDDSFSLAVYNEHTGSTLLRLAQPTLENLERAIKVMRGQDQGDF